MNKHLGSTFSLAEEYEKLAEENARYRAALEFYADTDNWDDDFTPTVWDNGRVDMGTRAREALGLTDAIDERAPRE